MTSINRSWLRATLEAALEALDVGDIDEARSIVSVILSSTLAASS